MFMREIWNSIINNWKLSKIIIPTCTRTIAKHHSSTWEVLSQQIFFFLNYSTNLIRETVLRQLKSDEIFFFDNYHLWDFQIFFLGIFHDTENRKFELMSSRRFKICRQTKGMLNASWSRVIPTMNRSVI